MSWINEAFGWIAEQESVLSGIAAAIAIAAVVIALGTKLVSTLRDNRVARAAREPTDVGPAGTRLPQEIRYVRTADDCKVAWSSAGEGYPLIRSLGWFTHLEREWNSPVASPFWQMIAANFHLIRYDGRGIGMSDREFDSFSEASRLEDLEAVVDAAGVEKVALLGMSEGGATAIRYAVKYPQRVSHIVFWGSFLRTPDATALPQLHAIAQLVPEHWGSDNEAFHQMFTATFLPDGDAQENRFFNDMQRASATPRSAGKFLASIGGIDVSDVAGEVNCPCLVLHRRGDLAIPLQYGRDLAAQLPDAKLVVLEGRNHWNTTHEKDLHDIAEQIKRFVLADAD